MPGFKDIIGQNQIREHLENAVNNDKVSHAYIICGEKYSGKKFISEVFAKALMCESETDVPCGKCRECLKVETRNHPDVIYVNHEKPNIIGVEDIRSQVNQDINIKPYSGKRKVYIIDEAEKMNPQAQNAILKTFEEPPEYAVILLLVTNAEVLLPTIRSRAVTLNMKPVADELIKKHLMETVLVPDYKADICVAFSRGNIGKAVLYANSDDFETLKNELLQILKNIKTIDISKIMNYIKKPASDKGGISDFLDIIMIWYRDALLLKAQGNSNNLIFREELQYINKVAESLSFEDFQAIFDAIELTKRRITSNVNAELSLELLFLEIQEKYNS